MNAESLYGCSPIVGPAAGGTPTAHMGTDDLGTGVRSLVNPRNPLFWFGVLLVATAGFAGLAGSVRLGPAKLSGAIGKA